MDSISTEYIIFVYGILALPYAVAALALIVMIVATILYNTKRQYLAVRLIKVAGLVLLSVLSFTLFARFLLGM